MNEMSAAYTKEQTLNTIREAREIFQNKNTSFEKYQLMEKGLAFAYLYCPEELMELVEATLNEAVVRKLYLHNE